MTENRIKRTTGQGKSWPVVCCESAAPLFSGVVGTVDELVYGLGMLFQIVAQHADTAHGFVGIVVIHRNPHLLEQAAASDPGENIRPKHGGAQLKERCDIHVRVGIGHTGVQQIQQLVYIHIPDDELQQQMVMEEYTSP